MNTHTHTHTHRHRRIYTVLCVPGGLSWKDCVMWVHQNGSRETCPARYDFMSYVSLRWGQRSINPVCVCMCVCVCVCVAVCVWAPLRWWLAAGETTLYNLEEMCVFVCTFWPCSLNRLFAVCAVGGDAVVPSPRSAAPVQLRHTGGPVECWLHLCWDV